MLAFHWRGVLRNSPYPLLLLRRSRVTMIGRHKNRNNRPTLDLTNSCKSNTHQVNIYQTKDEIELKTCGLDYIILYIMVCP